MPDLTLWTNRRLGQLKRDMELLFDSLRRDMGMSPSGAPAPRFSTEETDSALVVVAEVPGYGPEDLSVSLHEDVLTLRGERREDMENGEAGTMTRTLSFSQSLRLPCPVDPDGVEAVFKDGRLSITMPKCPPRGPRSVSVKVG
ncbi:MAG: Hsp20/alpha crystallin family protein [Thermodesulfobacteriota bacterium]